ncbi:MAG TPA: NAD-dependent deacylase [Thermomicrobiales bacterium]|jgi:NAD-dependent deacetylase|nr:NAD-dependent deacylase [Thermomicrobiales bacterium]
MDTGASSPTDRLARLIGDSRRLVVLTGAGISTESGIPDYRGPQGVWTTGKIPHIRDLASDPDSRRAYWASWLERYPSAMEVKPNQGHLALVALERAGILDVIVTQNIDGLHVAAGNDPDRVLELHGSRRFVKCQRCGTRFPSEEIFARLRDGEIDPPCTVCEGPLRSSTVLFGESLPIDTLRSATQAARSADLLLVVGSSLVVNPAARLPSLARQAGAPTVIINREATAADDDFDLVIHADAGPTLNGVVQALGLPDPTVRPDPTIA